MTWTYSRHIHLSVRHPWGRVWVEARCEDKSVEWRVEAEAIANDGTRLAHGQNGGWQDAASGGRADARKAMQDLAARLAAHIEKARGGV